MCPDPQLLSIYMDGELPSPWKEKLENHLKECADCTKKLEGYRQLFGKKNEQDLMEEAKDRVWQNLQSRASHTRPARRFSTTSNLWQRKLTLPIPAAAAAAVVIMLVSSIFFRGGTGNVNMPINQIAETQERGNFVLTAEEEVQFMPTANISDVLQYLGSGDTNIIILQMPESGNFLRSGEPAIIRAADFSGNEMSTRYQPDTEHRQSDRETRHPSGVRRRQ